jgi:hypothetical protein
MRAMAEDPVRSLHTQALIAGRVRRRARLTCAGIAALVALAALPAGAAPRGKRRPRQLSSASSAGELVGRAASADVVNTPGASCHPRRDALVYHGGDLVQNADVFLIFWGTEWQTDPTHIAAKADVIAMFQQLGTSGYVCSLQEFSVPGSPITTGTYNGSEIIASAPPSPLPDVTIQQRILTEIDAGRAPVPSPDRVYVVLPPSGVPVDAGGPTGCGGSNFAFCGYHDSFAATFKGNLDRFRYAVLPFPCNSGGFTCFIDGQGDAGLSLQVVGSHELAETITDPDQLPVGASGWYSDRTGQENADICAAISCNGVVTVPGPQTFLVNSLWSNLANGCVESTSCTAPPVACTDPSAPGDCIANKGSSSCVFEWLVYPNLTLGSNGLPAASVRCADGQPFCDFDGVQDGQCTFHVAGCLNSDDPRVACTQTSINSITLQRPSPSSPIPSDSANATALVTALRTADGSATGTVSGGTISYSPAASTHNACTGYLDIVVPSGAKRTITVALQTAGRPVRSRLKLNCAATFP